MKCPECGNSTKGQRDRDGFELLGKLRSGAPLWRCRRCSTAVTKELFLPTRRVDPRDRVDDVPAAPDGNERDSALSLNADPLSDSPRETKAAKPGSIHQEQFPRSGARYESNPHSPTPEQWSSRGDAFLNAERPFDAIDCYRKALSSFPSYAPALEGLAFSLLQTLQRALAIEAFDRLIEIGEANAVVLNGQGMAREMLGLYEEALSIYRAAQGVPYLTGRNGRELGPGDLRRNETRVLLLMGRAQEAVACLEMSMGLHGANVETWVEIGTIHEHEGAPLEAEGAFRKAVELDPSSAAAWFGLGRNQQLLGHLSDAIDSLRTCVSLDPEHVHGWSNLGGYLAEAGEAEEGLECLQHALKRDPTDAISWWWKAVCERRLGRTLDARTSLRKILTLDSPVGMSDAARNLLDEEG